MKYKDIKPLSFKEVNDRLKKELDYLVKLKFSHSVSPIENPMKIRKIKKYIARLRTAQNSFRGTYQNCNHHAEK